MRVGRYKYNKKLGVAARIAGQIAAEDLIDPNTGEVIVREGDVIPADKSLDIQNAGINVVNVRCGNHVHRVVGNNLRMPAATCPLILVNAASLKWCTCPRCCI